VLSDVLRSNPRQRWLVRRAVLSLGHSGRCSFQFNDNLRVADACTNIERFAKVGLELFYEIAERARLRQLGNLRTQRGADEDRKVLGSFELSAACAQNVGKR